jgi:hypothetical protein
LDAGGAMGRMAGNKFQWNGPRRRMRHPGARPAKQRP